MPPLFAPPTFAQILAKPTTVAGMGITDVPLTVANVAVGAIGSIIMGWSNTAISPGSNESGSNISYCDSRGSTYTVGSPAAGTWKCAGASAVAAGSATIWRRIA